MAIFHPPGKREERVLRMYPDSVCEFCGTPFYKNKPNRRFCCDDCQEKAAQKRRRKRKKVEEC